MRKDPMLKLHRPVKLVHAQVRAQLAALRAQIDPPFNPDDIPVPLIAARARHNARP